MKLSSNLPSVQTAPYLGSALPDNAPRSVRTLPVGFDSDMKGADLDALMRFNETLPQPAKVKGKLPKKPGEADALGDTSEVVSDTPEWLASDTQEWQVAQAEIGAGAGAAAGGASTGGAGAAGAGAAGAGAAAGAGSAVAIVSPLAFTPSLLLVGGGGNDAPVITEWTSQLSADLTENQDTDVDTDGIQIVATGQVNFYDTDSGDTPVATVATADAVLSYIANGDKEPSALPEGLSAAAIKAAFSITEAGAWTFDASQVNLEQLGEGDTVTLAYTVTVTDDIGATDTVPVVITLTGTNDAPKLVVEHQTVYLEVNADSGQETTCINPTATDVDDGETPTLTYHFFVEGNRVGVSANGYFAIDATTGTISLTEKGALEAGVADYDLACAHYDVQVVVWDGVDESSNSNVVDIRIERTLPDLLLQGTDTLYSLSAMLTTDGEDYPYADGQVKLNLEGHHSVLTIDDTANIDVDSLKSFDILDLDIVGDMQAFSVEKAGASDNLLIKLQRQDDDEAGCLVVKDHYVEAGEASGAMEYIHFDHNSSYAGYQLSSTAEETLEACETSYFPENGSYRISTAVATKDGDQLVGSACNDLIAGSSDVKEHLSGGNGNDLLFASGCADSLEGGAGNDLLVMDGDHGRVVFSSAADNGRDTVANFDDEHEILLKQEGLSVAALTEDDDGAFCTNLADEIVFAYAEESSSVLVLDEEAASAAVIAMEADINVNPFNLHTWITSLEEKPEIEGIQVEAGASQYFLVEDADGNTQLYLGSDQGSDGMLTMDDFTHMAQFTDTRIDAFSYHNVLFAEPLPAPVL